MVRKSLYITLIIIFVILILLISFAVIFKINHKIDFEEVGVIKGKTSYTSDSSTKWSGYWFTVRDKSYNGFYDDGLELLEDMVESEKDLKKYNFDLKNNTYVITVGHELKEISYNFSQMKNRKLLIIPEQFIGNVVLNKENTNNIYIYRIKKMNIDFDYHDRMRGVIFS